MYQSEHWNYESYVWQKKIKKELWKWAEGGCERKDGMDTDVMSGGVEELETWSRNKEGEITQRGWKVSVEAILAMEEERARFQRKRRMHQKSWNDGRGRSMKRGKYCVPVQEIIKNNNINNIGNSV